MTGAPSLVLPDSAATEAAGAALAPLLRAGDVVTLSGGLGAGKTTFARGLIQALGHAGEVPSPSFAIVQPYEPPSVRLPVAHVDLYRVEDQAEIAELGLDEWLADGALLVEWPDRLVPWYKAAALALSLSVGDAGARILTADVPRAWEDRWPPR